LPILVFRGPLFEHYAVAFVPLTFLFLGFALQRLMTFSKMVFYWGALILFITQLMTPETHAPNDLYRTRALVDEMIVRAGDNDFSFAILSTRSFSDFHYRYFFLRKGISPRIIYDDDYPVLYLICEQTTCPSWKDLKNRGIVRVLCFEKYCEPTYPDKRLDDWELVEDVHVANSELLKLGKTKPVVQLSQ
jgi:hypothetical protein